MQISKVYCVYFSPCGSVAKVVIAMANYVARMLKVPVGYYDFTLPSGRENGCDFEEGELIFFGIPVYAGRVPNKIMPYIKEAFHGKNTLAVPVVVFGNRSFDDALVELRNILQDNRFRPIAGAAVASRHSFSRIIASDRPDGRDMEEIFEFSKKILEKLDRYASLETMEAISVPGTNPPEKYYTPLGIDGKPANFLKAVPRTAAEVCVHCGICAKNCPMSSISKQNPEVIMGICIKCQSCIRKCPKGAKYFDDIAFLSHKQMLEKTYTHRIDAHFFI